MANIQYIAVLPGFLHNIATSYMHMHSYLYLLLYPCKWMFYFLTCNKILFIYHTAKKKYLVKMITSACRLLQFQGSLNRWVVWLGICMRIMCLTPSTWKWRSYPVHGLVSELRCSATKTPLAPATLARLWAINYRNSKTQLSSINLLIIPLSFKELAHTLVSKSTYIN